MKAALAIAVTLTLGACKGEPPREQPRPPELVAVPVDHLAPGELIEGRDLLVGLRMPRDLKVRLATNDRGAAEGPIKPELVTNYLRARVKDGKMSVGASSTVFEGVHLASAPASAPLKELRVTVSSPHGVCRVEVWDITPPKAGPDPGNDAARWKAAGLNPNGTPLDPKNMQ